jgi:putative ABC transport system permease protein
MRDVSYALRTMRKGPGFTLVAVLTLALGIGGTTAVFSVVNALLLRPLPLPEPDRLLFLTGANPSRPSAGFPFSLAAYETIRDGNRSLAGITAFCGEGLTLTGVGDPAQLSASLVSPNFLEVLRVQPVLGRSFQPEEGEAGGKPVVLISQRLWQSRFASDPAILGRAITLGQDAYTIIGVMPAEFPFPFTGTDIWATRLMKFTGLLPDQIRNGGGYLMAIARLKPGVPLKQAEAEVRLLGQGYRQDHPGNPDADPRGHLELRPLQETLVTDIRPTLLILTGAVGFVLLIACANVAGLTLARAGSRAKEMVIRAALGAGRGTMIRQLLAESVLLAMAGAVAGVLLADWGVSLLGQASGVNLPGFQPIRVDLPVLGFTFAVSLVTGVLFGLVPALQISRPDLNRVLRDGGRGTTGGARRQATRSLLVAGQMALSIVLLIGAGLLLESFRSLQNVDPGFDPRHGFTMRVSLPPTKYPDDARRWQFIRNVVGRLQSLPGVSSATASLGLPLATAVMAPFLAEGQPVVAMGLRPLAAWNAIAPDYFKTLGVPLVGGRDFSPADDEHAPKRVIVSQSLARRFWPNEDAVGKRISYARRQVLAEIVGVARDVKTQGLEADAGMVFYTPYAQFAWPNMSLTLRTAGDPRQLFNAARAQVFAVDRDLPVINPRTTEDLLDGVLAQRRQTMYVVAGFAVVALLLAVIGLYGVMAYSVAQRTAEIGIRQAIGAQRRDILRMVMGQALRLSLAGIGVGVIASTVLTRLIARMLFHTSATDPVTYIGISILFLAIALAASYLPAWRATRIDPMTALRVG